MILLRFVKRNLKLLFFTWLILIFIAFSIPQLSTPRIKASGGSSIRLDYVIHFLEFFVLSVLFVFCMIDKKKKQTFLNWVLFIVLSVGLAFLIEFYQYLIPGRRFNIMDSIYNSLGFLIGFLFICLVKIAKNKDLNL